MTARGKFTWAASSFLVSVVLLLLLVVLTGSVMLRRALYSARGPDTSASNASRTAEQDGIQKAAISVQLTLPPLRKSPFMNTGSGAQYVGYQACIDCHEPEYQSYLQTHHSRAMGELQLSEEPPDGEFYHPKTKRRYVSERRDGKLIHTELLQDASGEIIAKSEHPVRMVIGSGHHSRSYFIERDGFLFESPLTWYAARNGWWLSPGYDRVEHDSFERPVDAGCVHCHAGRVEVVDGNRYRIRIVETTIGCESCHGPGSLHVESHQQGKVEESLATKSYDGTIVNPARLDRTLAEHICARCHLRGAASVTVRGRQVEDYRPGLYLTDFRINYAAAGNYEMTVVGHVEQMRQSVCWQKSDSLTCTTCHDPHKPVAQEQREEHYRRTCMECHSSDQCGMPLPERQKQTPSDSCVFCHMPQSATDIPHFAFTHHRIGIHNRQPSPPVSADQPVTLIPLDDVAHLGKIEERRCLGLAYMELADRENNPTLHAAYQLRAVELLQEVVDAGVDDPDTWAALARVAWQHRDWDRAVEAATRAAAPNTSSGARVNGLIILADILDNHGHHADAELVARELLKLRRFSGDYLLLASCLVHNNKLADAITLLERAVDLHPFRRAPRELLIPLLQRAGRTEDAARHLEVLQRLP
jgi:hypothetical protein